MDPLPIEPPSLNGDESYDLIILAYQVWFLSPSLPTTAFLQHPITRKLFKNKPVITLIACRNMWLMAQEAVKEELQGMDARLVGNVALVDEAGSVGSFLATPIWVLSGNKGPFLNGLIPKAGVSPDDIKNCSRFGDRIVETMLTTDKIDESLLTGLGAVTINDKLITSEKTAKRSFKIWGKLLRSLGGHGHPIRKICLLFYITFLISFIIVFIPISVLLQLLFSPFKSKSRASKNKKYFSRPSGEL